MIRKIEKTTTGDILEIKNDKLCVTVSNRGCTIMKILTEDKHGKWQDVVLGFDTIAEYGECIGSFGALVGRVANRIKGASFEMNGKTWELSKNDGENSIHGGFHGFSEKIFSYELDYENDEICFRYVSEDGEEGYPGELTLNVIYSLESDSLVIQYLASANKDTIINLTNHSYFNLSGHPCRIENHILKMQAEQYVCVDENKMPTGIIETVSGPFDFRQGKRLAKSLEEENHPQIAMAEGLDHSFLLSGDQEQVQLYCEESGIELIVSTTLPQAQICSTNMHGTVKGKYGEQMGWRNALCIETQYMPDSIHLEKDPMVILRNGETYDQTTRYRFHVR